MDLPPEILQTSMRAHQKYFSLRDAKTKGMANRFAVVSNMVSVDGGKQIVAGNERVLRARLSDAKFFWDQDRQHRLDSRVEALKGITFHAKLGTQYERVERIVHDEEGRRRRVHLYLQPEEGFEPWEPAPDYYAVLRRAYARLGFDRRRLAAAARVAA